MQKRTFSFMSFHPSRSDRDVQELFREASLLRLVKSELPLEVFRHLGSLPLVVYRGLLLAYSSVVLVRDSSIVFPNIS